MKTLKTAPGLTDSAVQWLWHRTEGEPFWSPTGNSWNVPIRLRLLFCLYLNSIPLSFLHFLALSLVIFFFLCFFSPYSCFLFLSFSFFLIYLSLYSFLQLFLSYVLPVFLFSVLFSYFFITLSFFLLFYFCYPAVISFLSVEYNFRVAILSSRLNQNHFKLLTTDEMRSLRSRFLILQTPQMLGVIQVELPRVCALYWYMPSDDRELSERITRAYQRAVFTSNELIVFSQILQ